ncbi:hypothetical protein QR680_000605 [Steinernema hermaphroditum]|uniref:Uncharacterized protein n=1 Tax=Steinernema hermaphroditum TaxID=289476 RepID=A0AA39GX68_9BILA|nr:hypothetical protein QR680_000605 [Steinernema hermaphroditum]
MVKLAVVVVFFVSALAVAFGSDYDVPLASEPFPLIYGPYVKKSELRPRRYNDFAPADLFGRGYRRMFMPRHDKSIRADSRHPLCFFTGLPCAIYE